MQTVNFLEQRSVNSIRKEINNIVDSYSNSWDILCELTQNSFDAIKRYNNQFGTNSRDHSIIIEFNVPNRSIGIRDTGIGIEAKKVKDVVAPNGTDKDEETDSIGEKGVGLTYTIFSCNNFTIETQNSSSFLKGSIKSASAWRKRFTDEVPNLNITEEKQTNETNETYTYVLLSGIDKFEPEIDDIFNQSIEIIEFILRTKTVIGFLKPLFDDSKQDISVSLIYTNYNNETVKKNIEFGYLTPDYFVGKNKINFDEFISKAATYDDKQKTSKLKGKGLVKIGSEHRAGRRINYYCFFAPSRNLWKEICEKNKLYIDEGEGNKSYLMNGGIFVATKGMPTGIILEPPISGFSGYWNNFFMILEDDGITFDLGRKTVPSRTKGILKDVAKKLFSDFLPYVKYITADPAVNTKFNSTIQQAEKGKLYSDMEKYADLGIDKICYKKHPNSQEAAVASIFHELVGANVLKGYYSLSTGYKQTYDLWAKYVISADLIGNNYCHIANNGKVDIPCVIEFKYKAESIIDDFNQDIKFFNDMDLLICWDLDETKFASHSIEVEVLNSEDVLFYGSNYKLIWPGSYNLGSASEKPVIALRKFIDDYIRK